MGIGIPAGPRNYAAGSIGTIVDGTAMSAAAQRPSPIYSVGTSGSAAQPDERPTQRIPPVQMTTQPPSAQEMADSAAADPEEETDPADPSGADDYTAAIGTGDGRPGSCRPGRETDPADPSGADDCTAAIGTGDGRLGSCRPGETDPADPSRAGAGRAAIAEGWRGEG